jgi:hypothetical protein
MVMTGKATYDLAAVRTAVDELAASPLHHMSLGSKELFHSNMLGWMAEQFPEFATEVLRPCLNIRTEQQRLDVWREWRNLDVVLLLPGHEPVVIESKMFALPDAAQLARYTGKLATAISNGELDSPTAVLLSLTDPLWPDATLECTTAGLRLDWQRLPYKTLAHRMREHDHLIPGGYAGETVRQYARMLDLLGRVLEIAGGSPADDDPVELWNELIAVLQRARKHHIVAKQRARAIAVRIAERLHESGIADRLVLNTAVTRGQPLVEVMQVGAGSTDTAQLRDRLLWQYQGGQIRLAAVLPSLAGKNETARKQREQAAEGIEDWFEFGVATAMFGDRCVGPKHEKWLRYDPDFVYRYVKVQGLTVGELVRLGTEYAQLMAKLPTPMLPPGRRER